MFDLSNFFDLSKKFTLSDTLLKSREKLLYWMFLQIKLGQVHTWDVEVQETNNKKLFNAVC